MRMRTDRMHGFIVVGLESGEEDIPPPPSRLRQDVASVSHSGLLY